MLLMLLAVVVVAIVGLIVGVRSLGHDVERWHVDPQAAPDPSSPNWYRVGPDSPNQSPVFAVSVDELSAALDRVVAQQPRTQQLADDRATGGPVTWVQRSAVFGFPDYVSVSLLPAGDDGSSTLAVLSRSRLGESDLGVNEKRVTAWLQALEAEVG